MKLQVVARILPFILGVGISTISDSYYGFEVFGEKSLVLIGLCIFSALAGFIGALAIFKGE